MPTYREILQREESKPKGSLLLFEEGIFLKAYEMSACFLSRKYGFKASKKYIKNLKKEVVSVGFPVKNLTNYFEGATIENGIAVVPVVEEIDEKTFHQWKDNIEVKITQVVPTVQQQIPLLQQSPSLSNNDIGRIDDSGSKEIISAVSAFPIETASPVDCMMFLIELKKKINAVKL